MKHALKTTIATLALASACATAPQSKPVISGEVTPQKYREHAFGSWDMQINADRAIVARY